MGLEIPYYPSSTRAFIVGTEFLGPPYPLPKLFPCSPLPGASKEVAALVGASRQAGAHSSQKKIQAPPSLPRGTSVTMWVRGQTWGPIKKEHSSQFPFAQASGIEEQHGTHSRALPSHGFPPPSRSMRCETRQPDSRSRPSFLTSTFRQGSWCWQFGLGPSGQPFSRGEFKTWLGRRHESCSRRVGAEMLDRRLRNGT